MIKNEDTLPDISDKRKTSIFKTVFFTNESTGKMFYWSLIIKNACKSINFSELRSLFYLQKHHFFTPAYQIYFSNSRTRFMETGK